MKHLCSICHSNLRPELFINDTDIDDTFESIFCSIISKIS